MASDEAVMVEEEEFVKPSPSLEGLLEKKSLKWVFVGGKGGVGKTTTSCGIAIELSKVREKVLLVSTDPAHNLSDAFSQQFSRTPTLVDGFPNLYAMEIEPSIEPEESDFLKSLGGENTQFIQDIALNLPGVDEAMSFTEVLRLVKSLNYSVVVFDTAPTGHTLRFLSMPQIMEKFSEKFLGVRNRLGGMLSQVSRMMGMEMDDEDMFSKLAKTKELIDDVNHQFKNADLTTFVCVCIPEFLSVYETERLLQELNKFEMDSQNLVVNQVLFPNTEKPCGLCGARAAMQKKYLDLISDLYEHCHVVKMPLLENEVRGVESLSNFSRYLFQQYRPPYPTTVELD